MNGFVGNSLERVATGIEGFDELIEGGFIKGSNVLMTGIPGTCKTIFGLEYLYNGALKGENGLYISLDSSIDLLRLQARQFGWDLDALEKAGKIFFMKVPIEKVKFNLFEMMDKIKNEISAKRVVFDSLATYAINIDLFTIPLGYGGSVASTVSMNAMNAERGSGTMGSSGGSQSDKIFYAGNSEKRMIYLIIEKLASLGTTNLIITYGNSGTTKLTLDGVSEFACDGIIDMYNELIGIKHIRTMSVLKMRNTSHSSYIHDFEIGKNGLIFKPAEQVYK